ncbi:ubiquinol-cytochrome c reductase iron-sulfur subunit [Gemmatimonas phototrophica]|uniref:QcrA and Rieske domain-containing protein n=1 Tax=Gemmatimonas phototrophica TaxID=1379270 RepID=UPI0006A725C8|nr:Rieske (2Fe-2S) protein [Gemmatimonas phototrophica]
MTSVHRREALTLVAACCICPGLLACAASQDAPTQPAPTDDNDDALTITPTTVQVRVDLVPRLTQPEGVAIFLVAGVIVVRERIDSFQAFSSVCPHAGCGVSVLNGRRLECPCHGSAFDLAGARLEGPAPSGLARLASSFDPARQVLSIDRRIL